MPLSKSAAAQAAERIRQAQSVLIVTHIRPDGDAVGSLLGLGLALQEMGRQVQMVVEDGIPGSLRHLKGSEQVRRKVEGEVDLQIVVDCSDLARTGKVFDNRPLPDINIDHHITNEYFAKINLVEDQAVATAEIIIDHFGMFGLELTEHVAAALLTGLITDTIGFRTPNVKSKTLCLAAQLMDTGVDMPELYRQALINRSFEAVKFWGAGLSKVERRDRLVWTTLTMGDRREAHYPGRDDADLINILSSIEDTDISIVFVEQPNGNTKVSWRAQPGFDVSGVAKNFGGGGHAAAAGAEISGNASEIQAQVLEQTLSLIDGGKSV
jgi:phosphoesterase RecJ-like protein